MAGQDKPRKEWLLDRQRSMIRKAASEGLSNLVQFALNLDEIHEVDPKQLVSGSGEEDVPLITACMAGHLDVVRDLVERCHAPIRCTGTVHCTDGETIKEAPPLWCAALSGNVELVRYLVSKGAKVNDSTISSKSTPLRVAVFEGHLPVVKCLVQNGADVNSTNIRGHSVLMNSCGSNENSLEIVRILLDNGADVNYAVPASGDSDLVGRTALHQYAFKGNEKIAKLLLQRGATISRDAYGDTPILIGAYKGHQNFVETLLDTSDCSRDDKADALELLGTECLKTGNPDTQKCLSLWKRAMEIRHTPGKPVARKRDAKGKIAVYKDAVEVQTMAELTRLQARGDLEELQVHGALITERVLGSDHSKTIETIRFVAALAADNAKYVWALDLLLHALSNLANTQPYRKTKVELYCFIIGIFVEMYEEGDQMRLKYVTTVLDMAVEEIRSGENEQKPSESRDEGFADRRHGMLKIPLHLILFGILTQEQATQQDGQLFSVKVRNLVHMNLRGKEGATLLHMACDADTANLPGDYHGGNFPLSEVVEALLKAGSDVNARNEAGQTALQVARVQTTDDISDVIGVLLAEGAQ